MIKFVQIYGDKIFETLYHYINVEITSTIDRYLRLSSDPLQAQVHRCTNTYKSIFHMSFAAMRSLLVLIVLYHGVVFQKNDKIITLVIYNFILIHYQKAYEGHACFVDVRGIPR